MTNQDEIWEAINQARGYDDKMLPYLGIAVTDKGRKALELLEELTFQGQWNKFVHKTHYWDFIDWLLARMTDALRFVNRLLGD